MNRAQHGTLPPSLFHFHVCCSVACFSRNLVRHHYWWFFPCYCSKRLRERPLLHASRLRNRKLVDSWRILWPNPAINSLPAALELRQQNHDNYTTWNVITRNGKEKIPQKKISNKKLWVGSPPLHFWTVTTQQQKTLNDGKFKKKVLHKLFCQRTCAYVKRKREFRLRNINL